MGKTRLSGEGAGAAGADAESKAAKEKKKESAGSDGSLSCRGIGRMHGTDYNIHAETMVMPMDRRKLVNLISSEPRALWIIKPASSSCGAAASIAYQSNPLASSQAATTIKWFREGGVAHYSSATLSTRKQALRPPCVSTATAQTEGESGPVHRELPNLINRLPAAFCEHKIKGRRLGIY